MKSKISFCIPCYRSEHTIEKVIEEIHNIMRPYNANYDHEIICVVDGSPDRVDQILKNKAQNDLLLKVVVLSKNFGQANARMASLRFASGDYFVCLDDDGQCPLDKFWDLFDPLLHGADVSIALYSKKLQSTGKNWGSKLNQLMISFLLDVPKNFQMSNFYCFKRFICEQILSYSNPYPYITGLLAQTTNNFAQVRMEERPRAWGRTGYTLRKLVGHWLDGFTSFSIKPLRSATLAGIVCSLVGFTLGVEAVARKLFFDDIQTGYTSIYAMILFTAGVIMFMLGLIGEYIGRIYICINRSPQFVVREKINFDCQHNEIKMPNNHE